MVETLLLSLFATMLEVIVVIVGFVTVALLLFKLMCFCKNIYIMLKGSPPDFKQYGKWAVVTGSTDGIGKAWAMELAHQGMNIALVSLGALEQTADEIEQTYHVKTKIMRIDFTAGPEIYDELKKGLDDIDIGVLVNNVGIMNAYPEYFLEGENKMEAIRNIMKVNMDAVTFLTYLTLPGMVKKGKGIIINIASIQGTFAFPLFAVYSSTKAYVDSLTQALAYEYRGSGVIIQSILPSMVRTNLSRKIGKNSSTPGPTEFVSSAINTVTRCDRTTGFWHHELQLAIFNLLESVRRGTSSALIFKLLKPLRNIKSTEWKEES